ncbi:MAG: hypothetical protein CMN78_03075 [Spirochaetales bacterium]|nr:hypothetical protein [Spirochaetales bacterium]
MGRKILIQAVRYLLLLAVAAISFVTVMIARNAFLTVLSARSTGEHWQTSFKHEVADKFSLIIMVIVAFGFVVSGEFSMAKKSTVVLTLMSFGRHAAILLAIIFISHSILTLIGATEAAGLSRWLLLSLELLGSIGLLVPSLLPMSKKQ